MNRAVMPITDYENTCDKIREKTETTDLIKSGELPDKIDEVYESGKADKEREMWDCIFNYGTKDDLNKAFYETGFEYIRPPYKITPTNMLSLAQTFSYAKNLKKVEAKYFDFSKKKRGTHYSHGLYWTFSSCSSLEEVEDIGLQPDIGLYNTFSWSAIKKIAMLRVNEQTQYEKVFQGCGGLEDVTFEGVIGQNGLSFGNSPLLTRKSLLNVIDCLKDFREITTITTKVTSTEPITITNGTLEEGERYTWSYYDSNHPGWVIDDAASYPTSEEVQITSTAGKVVVNGKEYTGFKASYTNYVNTPHVAGGYKIYVYQDGNEIKTVAHKAMVGDDIINLKLVTGMPAETHSIVLGTTNLAKLTDAEKAVATQKGWTLL